MIPKKIQIFAHKKVLAVLTLCIGLIAGTVLTMAVPDLKAATITINGATDEAPKKDDAPTTSKGVTITSNGNDSQDQPASQASNPTTPPEPTNSAPQSSTTQDNGTGNTGSNPASPAPCQ